MKSEQLSSSMEGLSFAARNRTTLRKTALIATFAGIMLFGSACGGETVHQSSILTESSSASPEVSETPAAPENTVEPVADGEKPDIGNPAPTGNLVTAPNGDTYLQSVLSPDDPALQLNPATLDESVATMDQAELAEAQRTVMTFIAEQGIDSPMNGGGMTAEEWWAKNNHLIHPDYHSIIQADLIEGKDFILNESWQSQYEGKYRYITSPDKPRIYDRTLTPVIVWELAEGTIAFEVDVSYKIPAVPGIGQTKTGIQITSGKMTYSTTKNPDTGQWQIDGYDHDIDTYEG